MDRLRKSDINFQFTKGEFKDIMEKPIDEYQCWLQLKKSEQIIDTLASDYKSVVMTKYRMAYQKWIDTWKISVLGEPVGFINFVWLVFSRCPCNNCCRNKF
jgi:hypothetical protein